MADNHYLNPPIAPIGMVGFGPDASWTAMKRGISINCARCFCNIPNSNCAFQADGSMLLTAACHGESFKLEVSVIELMKGKPVRFNNITISQDDSGYIIAGTIFQSAKEKHAYPVDAQ